MPPKISQALYARLPTFHQFQTAHLLLYYQYCSFCLPIIAALPLNRTATLPLYRTATPLSIGRRHLEGALRRHLHLSSRLWIPAFSFFNFFHYFLRISYEISNANHKRLALAQVPPFVDEGTSSQCFRFLLSILFLSRTNFCGWGAVALESIENGDFVIEYVGEVIDDALCEQRLWDMKRRGDQNFYMCEIQKDFTIDATFKGNASRFLNHSCDPNCKLEKWQVDGETRVGVFALQHIKAGEQLTYDYRFVQFGPMVQCFCGASNCQGFLGIRKKTSQANFSNSTCSSPWAWGCKRQRTPKIITKK